MLTAQVSTLILGLSYYNHFHGFHVHATDMEGCEMLAEKEQGKAVENVHSFAFFLLTKS